MVTSLKGVQLFLKVGKTIPSRAPYEVMTTLNSVEVNDDEQELRDGFQLHFTLVKDSTLPKNSLSKPETLFQPDTRVVIGVLLNTIPYVLISGVTTHFQLVPTDQPGIFTFSVIGKSITHQLNRKKENAQHDRLSDSEIVQKLVAKYAKYSLTLRTNGTTERPLDTYLIPHQSITDLQYIKELAKRNGYVFYSQPDTDGSCELYWGQEDRKRVQLPALTTNMGSATNVVKLSFQQNTDIPRKVQGLYLDPENKRSNSISPESVEDDHLAEDPLQPLNTEWLRFTAKYTSSQLTRAIRAVTTEGRDPVAGDGELDIIRYPHILEAGKVIEVRGAGSSYNGKYLIKFVKHSLERGKYSQSFQLKREGVGAGESRVERK